MITNTSSELKADESGLQAGSVSGPLYNCAERFLDIVVSMMILMLCSPLMIYVYFYIKRRSGGPPIFRQTRMKKDERKSTGAAPSYYKNPEDGSIQLDKRRKADPYREGDEDRRKEPTGLYFKSRESGEMILSRRKTDLRARPFVFYKFASMYPDAKQRFPELYNYKYSEREINEIRFKLDDDPRVPPWARWLRKSSVDELPNFVNVLKGDMTLVGPRPDIPEMLKYYTPEQQRLKMSVKPGITGLAQIRGRGDLTFQETLEFDLQYVKNRSLFLDLSILFETFIKLFTGRDKAY